MSCLCRLKEWNLAWTDLRFADMEVFLPCLPHSLRRFNISGHRNALAYEGVADITKRCPNLIELDISDSPMLSEAALNIIVKNCLKLEHLHTSRSYNIPTMSYRILKELKNFKKLEIFRTLMEDALADLRSFLPDVKINQCIFSTVARPTTGIRRTSIWGLRVRD
ncbi:S-phase kinase-associated protein 2-like [Uloborus diversus]|uniref:S-phase kinase-associated protein 2-like n=1 Tax=Uloborus diversus TaxID=327109 RepID=UPI0024093C89|nr:S-phase kinase-associated protein 2-like [Uloborus diversus]